MDNNWKYTRECLSELMSLLNCIICKRVVNKPVSLGGCEHFLCKDCADDLSQCPVCQLPSHAKDIQTDRQLATAASLCQRLNSIILSDESSTQKLEAVISSSPKYVKETSVYDFIGSPASDSPSATVAGRTRKRTKVTKRNKAVKVSNKVWSIGEGTKVRCDSCNKSGGRKVCFENCDHTAANMQSAETEEKTMPGDNDVLEATRLHRSDILPKTDAPKCSTAPTDENQPWVELTPINNTSSSTVSSYPAPSTPLSSTSAKPKRFKRQAKSSTKKIKSAKCTPVSSTPQFRAKRISTPKGGRLSSSQGTTSSPLLVKKNAKGETPLQIATIKGDISRVKGLIAEGAPVNVKDHAGWTPLHEACNHGFYEIVEILLDSGALINIPGLDNDTPLHDAVINHRVECVKLLVSRGASPTVRNAYGKSPVDLAMTDVIKEALQTPLADTRNIVAKQTIAPNLAYNQPVILLTGLTREQRSTLQKCGQLIHGKVVEDYSFEVTHVVSSTNQEGLCGRTMKNLKALITGKWIVNFEWVTTCLEYKEKVCEEAFEVPGMSTHTYPLGPLRSRSNFEQQLPGLFAGCYFYLMGEFEYPAPSKEELSALLKLGGATLLTREPKVDSVDKADITVPYHTDPDSVMSSCSYFKVSSGLGTTAVIISPIMALVPYTYVFNCVTNFKIINIVEK